MKQMKEAPPAPAAKAAASPTSPKSVKSASSSPNSIEKHLAKDHYQLVNKVMEGLRGDAFLVARDMGFAALSQPGGLRSLVAKIKASVFPRPDSSTCAF